MIRILTGVKVRHAACGAILRRITASKGSKGSKGRLGRRDPATWSTRTFMPFVCQRISVAIQLAMAQQIAEAMRMSVAADPRAAP